MAPKLSVLGVFNARKELLALNLQSGMSVASPDFAKLSANTVSVLQAALKPARIHEGEGPKLLQILLDMPLLDHHRAALVQGVNEKLIDESQTPTPGEFPKQEMPNPELWLAQPDWDQLLSPTVAIKDRVFLLASKFVGMGHYYPTPAAVRNIVAVALHDQGQPHSLVRVGVTWNKVYKNFVKGFRKSRGGSPPPPSWCRCMGKWGGSVQDQQRLLVQRSLLQTLACGAADPCRSVASIHAGVGVPQYESRRFCFDRHCAISCG